MAERQRDVGLEATLLLIGATSDSEALRRLTLSKIDHHAIGAVHSNNCADETVLVILANRLVGPDEEVQEV